MVSIDGLILLFNSLIIKRNTNNKILISILADINRYYSLIFVSMFDIDYVIFYHIKTLLFLFK